MKKIKLQVKGMHCKSCEAIISDSLSEMDGVKSSKANHQKGTVEIEFDESKVKEEDFVKAIKKEGYTL